MNWSFFQLSLMNMTRQFANINTCTHSINFDFWTLQVSGVIGNWIRQVGYNPTQPPLESNATNSITLVLLL